MEEPWGALNNDGRRSREALASESTKHISSIYAQAHTTAAPAERPTLLGVGEHAPEEITTTQRNIQHNSCDEALRETSERARKVREAVKLWGAVVY